MSTVRANNYYDASGGSAAQLYGVSMRNGGTAFVNRIINGDMRIDQRNAGASVTIGNNDTYAVDRFAGFSNVGTTTGQQSTVAPAGFTNSLLYTQTAGGSVTASSYLAMVHRIEGFNVADLGWGTANAQTITLSFRVRSSVTGTFSVVLQNSTPNRSYVATYTISAANTWEEKTITVPGDTSGTWLTNNGRGLLVLWNLGYGSNFTTSTTNSWLGSGVYGSTSSTTAFATTTGATFYIAGVQLEAGTVASPFQRVEYGEMLRACQRYYQVLADIRYSGSYDSTTDLKQLAVPLLTQMRAAPTATFTYSYGNGATTSSAVATNFTSTSIWDLRSINVSSGVMSSTSNLSAEL